VQQQTSATDSIHFLICLSPDLSFEKMTWFQEHDHSSYRYDKPVLSVIV